MDASSSTKATIELFKQLLEILEEENAFDRTGNEPLVQFVHPDELQVSYDSKLHDHLLFVHFEYLFIIFRFTGTTTN